MPMFFEKKPDKCKHDQGFVFGGMSDEPRTWGWYCSCGCSFFLNFDPTKFPEGVAYLFRKAMKKLPDLVSSKW
jgi:hypothetical protein